MKSVLIFTTEGDGGAERVSVTIGKYLYKNNFSVKFCVVKHGISNSSIIDFIPRNFRTIIIEDANPILMAIKLIYQIRKMKPDIVFSSSMYLNSKILSFRSCFPKIRFIIRSENNMDMFDKRQRLMMRYSYGAADAIIAQNQEMKTDMVNLLGLSARKIVVLHNPLDVSYINDCIKNSESPYKQINGPVFVALGRFAHQKGFDILARAFAIVHDEIPQSHLFIIGDTKVGEGKVYNEIRNYARMKGVDEYVHCPGFKTNPYPWIKYANCFVLSSRMEGLPNVLIEAQYLGVPAAATTCIPFISEIIKEGENGSLAEVDNEKSLAVSMMRAVKLGNVITHYTSASMDDFLELFLESK